MSWAYRHGSSTEQAKRQRFKILNTALGLSPPEDVAIAADEKGYRE